MTGAPGWGIDMRGSENAGATLADVSDDLAGIGRPVGAAFDIGAFEYLPWRLWLPLVLKR